MERVRARVLIAGQVQGVNFRAYTRDKARAAGVEGWVRNLPDGRVEMQVSGDADEVEAFIEAIAESELKGHIKKMDTSVIPPLTGVRGFEIAH